MALVRSGVITHREDMDSAQPPRPRDPRDPRDPHDPHDSRDAPDSPRPARRPDRPDVRDGRAGQDGPGRAAPATPATLRDDLAHVPRDDAVRASHDDVGVAARHEAGHAIEREAGHAARDGADPVSPPRPPEEGAGPHSGGRAPDRAQDGVPRPRPPDDDGEETPRPRPPDDGEDPIPLPRRPGDSAAGPRPAALSLTNPTDIIATLPYLVGEPPDPGVVVLAIRDRGVHSVFCGDLDRMDAVPDPLRRASLPVGAAVAEGCTALAVVAYGPPERVTPYVDALLAAARASGLHIVDALRVTGGRYWSYTCPSAGCCPAEGTVVNVDGSTVPASAVLHGIVPAPPFRATMADAARVHTLLLPVDGEERSAMDAASERVAEGARRLLAQGRGAVLTDRGRAAVAAAVRAEREDDPVTAPERLAWLGVYLALTRVRDEAWARITAEDAPAHQALWSRVARHLPPGQRAAPASLLAVAAWQRGDRALAVAALDVALTADAGYSMAVLMSRALAWGLPVERWREFTPRWLRGEVPPPPQD